MFLDCDNSSGVCVPTNERISFAKAKLWSVHYYVFCFVFMDLFLFA